MLLDLGNGLSDSQTMACRMLQHVLGIRADVPTVRHSAQHRYAEMKADMIVMHLVILGGVHAQQTLPGIHLLLEHLTPVYDLPILLNMVH